MKKIKAISKEYYDKADKAFESRNSNEKFLLSAIVIAVMFCGWLVFVSDPLNASLDAMKRSVASSNTQIIEAEQQRAMLQASVNQDPNAPVRARYAQLLEQVEDVDLQLSGLFGQLISPQEMASVLTSVLQSETSLELIGLENIAPVSMIQSDGGNDLVEVYQHGLKMEFEGEYLETIRYLNNLEQLDTNFFWETMTYEEKEYPVGKITMRIFTLSADEGWIGV